MPQSFFLRHRVRGHRVAAHMLGICDIRWYFNRGSVAVALRMEVALLGGVGVGGDPVGLDRFRVPVHKEHVAVGAAVALGIPELVGALTL